VTEFPSPKKLHCSHVSLIERGKRNPTLEVIKKLATALGTTIAFVGDNNAFC
jgi:transcriptional regulator with XRE-family HTH domain